MIITSLLKRCELVGVVGLQITFLSLMCLCNMYGKGFRGRRVSIFECPVYTVGIQLGPGF